TVATRSGCAQTWWGRSSTPNAPRTADCATPSGVAGAPTRTRATCAGRPETAAPHPVVRAGIVRWITSWREHPAACRSLDVHGAGCLPRGRPTTVAQHSEEIGTT